MCNLVRKPCFQQLLNVRKSAAMCAYVAAMCANFSRELFSSVLFCDLCELLLFNFSSSVIFSSFPSLPSVQIPFPPPSPSLIVCSLLLLTASVAHAATATISIDLSQRGPKLNPRMYGIFLEEINHGVDGGLYAEMVRNRGFEDAKPPEGFIYKDGRWVTPAGYDAGFDRFGYFTNGLPFWNLSQTDGAHGSMSLDLSDPLTAATPRSLRLEIDDPGPSGISIVNEGFFGIGAKSGRQYKLSFWARANNGFTSPISSPPISAIPLANLFFIGLRLRPHFKMAKI